MKNKLAKEILFNEQETYIQTIAEINMNYIDKYGKKKKYHIITYGCQMNVHDSERLAGMLEAMGYEETENIEEANLVIFNTCAVREHAESRVYGNIGPLRKYKNKNDDFILAVCGCMPQQSDAAKRIANLFPFVDIIFGTKNLYRFPEMLYKAINSSSTIIDIDDNDAVVEGIPVSRKEKVSAWVNIIYGCNNFCSYCIVPYVRGRERSRRPEEIIYEIEQLTQEGVVEVTLLGQNVNSYGKDLDIGIDFADLLEKVNEIPNIKRIRFVTSHPKDLTDKLIDTIATLPKVCEHLHLPVQSGSTRILRVMNRQYTKEDYLRLVEKIKNRIPDISLTTDIIVGFPTETEEDFEDTLDIVRRVEFDSAFTFLYSKRKGTKAASMENQIPQEVKHKRFNRLVNLVEEISLRKNLKLIGSSQEILIDNVAKKNNLLVGRTRTNKLVHIQGDMSLMFKFVNVKISDATGHWLKGEVL